MHILQPHRLSNQVQKGSCIALFLQLLELLHGRMTRYLCRSITICGRISRQIMHGRRDKKKGTALLACEVVLVWESQVGNREMRKARKKVIKGTSYKWITSLSISSTNNLPSLFMISPLILRRFLSLPFPMPFEAVAAGAAVGVITQEDSR